MNWRFYCCIELMLFTLTLWTDVCILSWTNILYCCLELAIYNVLSWCFALISETFVQRWVSQNWPFTDTLIWKLTFYTNILNCHSTMSVWKLTFYAKCLKLTFYIDILNCVLRRVFRIDVWYLELSVYAECLLTCCAGILNWWFMLFPCLKRFHIDILTESFVFSV